MKNFFQLIKDSVYSPRFYAGISKTSFKRAYAYFFLLILALSIVRIIYLTPILGYQLPQQLNKSVQSLVDCYPTDLQIDISAGQATTSAKQPYFVSCDKNTEASKSAILVVDTNTPYSQDQFDRYAIPMWLTSNSLVVKDNVKITSYDLLKVTNLKLNKTVVDSTYKSASKYFVFVGPVLLLLAFLVLYIGYVFNLTYLLIISLVFWLIFSVMKKSFSYTQLYKTGLYAMTLPMIVELILSLVQRWIPFNGFPFMFSIITFGVIYFNTIQSSERKINPS